MAAFLCAGRFDGYEYLALKVYELGVFFYVSKLPYNSIERLFLYCLNNVL